VCNPDCSPDPLVPGQMGPVTDLAVMGFGAGAFLMGQIGPKMILSEGVAKIFYIVGVIFLVLVTAMAQFYKNQPKGWLPVGVIPQTRKKRFSCGFVLRSPKRQRHPSGDCSGVCFFYKYLCGHWTHISAFTFGPGYLDKDLGRSGGHWL
jgi:hypothetical protein